jgi:hypothetical protein
MTEISAPFSPTLADQDQVFFSVEGPMTDDRPWREGARTSHKLADLETFSSHASFAYQTGKVLLPQLQPAFRREAS